MFKDVLLASILYIVLSTIVSIFFIGCFEDNIGGNIQTESVLKTYFDGSFIKNISDTEQQIKIRQNIIKEQDILLENAYNEIDKKDIIIKKYISFIENIDFCALTKKVIVCHNNNEISINISSLKAHLAHGDYIGNCIE